MLVEQALAALKDAKIDKRDWRDISGIIDEIMKSRAWRDAFDSPSAWLEAAATASGYSASILRRMVTARDFLERVKEGFGAQEILVDTTTRAPFATIEILKRVHDIDPEKAGEMFEQVLAGKVSHRDVLATYSDMMGPSPYKVPGKTGVNGLPRGSIADFSAGKFGKRAASDFVAQAKLAIQHNLAKLTGDPHARFYFQEFKFNYTSPDAVALRFKHNGIEWVDAFDIRYLTGGLPRGKRNQLIAEMAFSATFFRNYWIILEKAGDLGISIAKDLRSLELQSIGVAEFEKDKPEALRILLKPELSAQPNRQPWAIRDVMQQGISDIATF